MASPVNTTTLGNWGKAKVDFNFGSFTLTKVYDVEFSRLEEKIHRAYISGERDKFSMPNGWTGRFTFDRLDSSAEDAFARMDQRMDQNGFYDNAIITLVVTDPNGVGGNTLTFYGAACSLSQGGTYRQNSVVSQTITFEAATMSSNGAAAQFTGQ